ncbi:hypothetical protein JXA05_04215 [Candidatus Peregrinibacteria bacterium]|nr:hypothetical protein [Candidatus Peregrinibacteria bacterium]
MKNFSTREYGDGDEPEFRQESQIPLTPQMRDYLAHMTHVVDENLPPDELEAVLKKFMDDDQALLRATGYLDQVSQQLDSEESLYVLPEARQIFISARQRMGETFCDTLTVYYKELEALIQEVHYKIKKWGVNFFISGDGYNKESAAALEKVSVKMMEGRSLSNNILDPLSAEYRKTPKMQPNEQTAITDEYIKSKDGDLKSTSMPTESSLYHLEQKRLYEMIKAAEANENPESIARMMNRFTRDLLKHISEELGGQTMNVLLKPDGHDTVRNFDIIAENPLHQIEFLVNIAARSIRVLNNIRDHRDLLDGGVAVSQNKPDHKESAVA